MAEQEKRTNTSSTQERRTNTGNGKDIVSKDKMLEAGVYFGHRTAQWNPKMKPYILMSKKGTHIIDIQKTKKTLEFAYGLIKRMSERGADFIFVGTRKQAKATVKENALRTNSFYMSERWLGGTLTNNRTIFQRVKRMFELEKLQENDFAGYTKKEGVLFSKELAKLQKNLSGIKDMRRRPSVMIVTDVQENLIAIKEAKRLGMRVIGLVDTNDDPTSVDVAIPCNNDSIKSITLITTILGDAVAAGKNGAQLFAYQADDAIVLPEELKKEFKPRRRFDNRRPNPKFQNRRPSAAKPEDKKVATSTVAKNEAESKAKATAVAKDEVKREEKDLQKVVAEAKADKSNDFSKLKVAELKELVAAKGLTVEGKGLKADLVAALEGAK